MRHPEAAFAAAAGRKLLESHPELGGLLDAFAPLDRAQFVSRWLGTFAAQRPLLVAKAYDYPA